MITISFILIALALGTCISFFAINPDPMWLNAIYSPLLALGILFVGILILVSILLVYGAGYKKGQAPTYSEKGRLRLSGLTDFILRLFTVKLETNGFDKIPEDQAFLLVGNHRSNIDTFIVDKTLRKRKLIFVAKNSLFKKPLLPGIIGNAGYIELDRSDIGSGFAMMKNAQKYINEGVSVGIFPEGTRNKIEGEVGAFHNGAFIAAMKIKAPIVVCALHNTHGVNDNLLFKAHKIKLNCVKVYYYEDYKDMDANKLGDEIHALMVEDLKNK